MNIIINKRIIVTENILNSSESLSTIDSATAMIIHGWHHPNISPIFLELGPLQFRWYSMAYLAGIILGWLYIKYMNRKYANSVLPEKAIENLPLWIVASVILGGRLGYVLFYNLEYYLNNLAEIIKIWQGGMSFHGGLSGVIIGSYIFSRVYKISYFKLTDLLAIVTPIGLFFGRIANFINKELYGKITNSPIGVIYPNETFARHPSQLYEATLEGLVLFIILNITLKLGGLKRTGLISGMFLTGYGIFRAFCEIFRQPDEQIGYLFNHISMGQVLCLPMILAGVGIMAYSRNLYKKNSKTT